MLKPFIIRIFVILNHKVMLKQTTLIFLLVIASSLPSFAQNNVYYEYYKDEQRKKQVPDVSKAKFRFIRTEENDSIVKMEFFNLKKNRIQWSETYLNGKPYGTWLRYDKKTDKVKSTKRVVTVKYGEYIPEGYTPSFVIGENEIINSNQLIIQQHILTSFYYPEIAKENGYQGKVKTQFTLDENGNIDHISIVEGIHPELDRACYTIISNLPRLQPVEKDGKKIKTYHVVPIVFRLV